MNKKYIYLICLMIASYAANAQTIRLEFPHLAGKTYEFKIVQGDRHIVLQQDTIPKDGKVQLQIPIANKGYRGMSMWYITNSKTGGGLEMIINNEDFSVSCFDPNPTAESIIYKNTQENTFLTNDAQEQQNIFEKHDAMLSATKAYNKTHPLYPVFTKEYDAILKEYSQFIKRLKNSNAYASRFREIANITMGIGSFLTEDENLKAKDINNFIVNQMDYEALYTSNHWGGIVNNWVQLQTMVIKNDSQFVTDAKTILNRLPSDKIYTDFVKNITKELTKIGKDYIITGLTPEIKKSNKLLNYDGVLSVYQKDLTGKAPDLVFVAHKSTGLETKTIDIAKLKNKYTLLVFYQSGCGACQETIQELKTNYKDFLAKGIEILTVSADTDEHVFKDTATQYPWTNKYCDFQGMDGINFKNYAVIGTPTMYILDKKGFIISKIATINQLLDWIKEH